MKAIKLILAYDIDRFVNIQKKFFQQNANLEY